MNKENKTPKEIASEIVNKVGIETAIDIVNSNINDKRKEKPSALKVLFLVEELNFLHEVKKEIEKL